MTSIRAHELEAELRSPTLSDHQKIDSLHRLAWEYTTSNRDVAHLIQQARALLDSLEADLHREHIHQLILARQDYVNGHFTRVLERARPLLVVFQGDDEWLWRTRFVLINAYQQLGEYALMWEVAEEQLQNARNNPDSDVVTRALSAMGIACTRSGDYDRALDYFAQCRAVAEASSNIYSLCVVNYHETSVYTALGQLDTALNSALRAVDYSTHLTTFPQTHALLNLSDIYMQVGDMEGAMKAATDALNLSDHHDRAARMRINLHLGEIYHRLGQTEYALELLHKALPEADAMQAKEFLFRCHKALADVFKQKGDYEKALHHFEQFHAVRTRVYNQDSDQRLKMMEALYRTQQAQAEAEQQRLLREQDRAYFQQLSLMKDDFIAAASHDLKNPLTSIRMVLYLLKRYAGHDSKVLDYVERLSLSADKMQALITDMLDLARLETGFALKSEPVAAASFVGTVVEEYHVLAQDRNISLKFSCDLPDIIATFDPVQIRRVIDNLLSNAIKYTPNGGAIEVSVEQDSSALIVRVRDSGAGIPGEDLPHIFERFYRISRDRQSDVEGTGLGLSIVKSIVEQHGGKVWVASEVQRGSTFSFTLPLKPTA